MERLPHLRPVQSGPRACGEGSLSAVDPSELSVSEGGAAMASGRLKSRDLVEALIERCQAHADLNAFVSTDWQRLRDDADAADAGGKAGRGLGGIPLCLKDNINTAILPTSAGTGALAGWVAPTAAPVAKSLFDAGALLGATGNMHELAFGITSNNSVTGPVRNPWNPSLIAGGSSGGVAAAVAARLMPAGIGTDTGASVRLPAALCGIVGFRPTVGRYPGEGIVPISHTRDTAGPIARNVADARLLDSILAGKPDSGRTADLSGLRLGVPRHHFYDSLDAETADNAESALRELQAAGVTLIEADIADIAALNDAVGFPVALYEFMTDLPRFLEENRTGLSMQQMLDGAGSPDVKGLFASQMGDEAMPEAAYRQAMDVDRPKLQAAYGDYFKEHDVDAIVFPTTPMPARPIGDDEDVELNGARAPTFPTFIRNTDPGSNAAIPGISLPSGLTSGGLPLGMEFDGPAGSDDRLLAIAAAIEPVFAFAGSPACA